MNNKKQCLILIVHLIISIFAISFMIGMESGGVSGEIPEGLSANLPAGGADFDWVTEATAPWDALKAGKATFNGVEGTLTQEITKDGSIWKFATKDGSTITELTSDNIGGIKATGGATATKSGNWFTNMFKPTQGAMGILKGAGWAMTAYWVAGMIGDLLGLSASTTKSLQYGSAAAVGTYYGINAFAKIGTTLASWSPFIGIGVGVAVFVLTYKKEKYETVAFNCLPWEAPIGGDDCEKCNDGIHICSEYRCKSLGQACNIVNKGTDKEQCVWTNPKDVASPTIEPWAGILTKGYSYSNTQLRPPSWGTSITRIQSADPKKCIAAFTPITFGILTNKPAQCKIDFALNKTTKFTKSYDQMTYYFGESNLYDYNHTQTMNLPSPSAVNNEAASLNTNDTGGLEIQNNGEYTMFVRCKSANGFFNQDPYVISFCVDKGPDTTAPRIEETSIRDGQPVQFGVDNLSIIVYTNEPATCRWSRTDQRLDKMENSMTCATSISQMQSNMYYACTGKLTGIKDRVDNQFYFKCEDQPWMPKTDRNEMTESYSLILKGTQPLNIKKGSVEPSNGTITGTTTTVDVTLQLETENGYNEGNAECSYSIGDTSNYIPMLETNSYIHKQRQDLVAGTYNYFFKCVDLGGNTDTANTTFTVKIDNQAPQAIRVMFDSDRLKLITDEDAECVYSLNDITGCNYNMDDANAKTMVHEITTNKKEQLAAWDLTQTYYIKCKDKNNAQPNPTKCTITIKPVDIIKVSS
ncbi:MAG: hypothetical protein WC781_04255 [Candidatus Pacearchaeota archaeon]|jgi:hypothetical protein